MDVKSNSMSYKLLWTFYCNTITENQCLNFFFFASKIVVELKHVCPIFNVYGFYLISCFGRDIINRNENKLIHFKNEFVYLYLHCNFKLLNLSRRSYFTQRFWIEKLLTYLVEFSSNYLSLSVTRFFFWFLCWFRIRQFVFKRYNKSKAQKKKKKLFSLEWCRNGKDPRYQWSIPFMSGELSFCFRETNTVTRFTIVRLVYGTYLEWTHTHSTTWNYSTTIIQSGTAYYIFIINIIYRGTRANEHVLRVKFSIQDVYTTLIIAIVVVSSSLYASINCHYAV